MPEPAALEPGTRLEVTLERAAALGRTVARVDGLTVLVSRGLPGERVTVEVERTYPRYVLARVVEVLRPALARVEPACAHYGHCGGCDWQHADAATQVALKRDVLNEQLQRIGHIDWPADWALIPAPQPLGYRDKLEFTPLAHDGRWVPAYHDPSGQVLVPITHCRLAPESYTQLAQAVLDALSRSDTLPPAEVGVAPPLQRITVQATERGEGSPGLAVLLHLRAPRDRSEGQLRRAWQQAGRAILPDLLHQFPHLAAFALQFPARIGGGASSRRGGKAVAARRGGPTVEVLRGPRHLRKRVHGRAYALPHAGFFQVNPDMAGTLVAHVVEQVQQALAGAPPEVAARPVFDLYGGVGLFTLPLAERGLRVLGVDSDREGLRAAEYSAGALGLETCAFQREDLERAGALERLLEMHGPPSVIICDPPRRGLAAPLSAALAALAASQGGVPPAAIVYVSCDGGTFARDTSRLNPHWHLAGLRGFDQFPQTHHLELTGTFVPSRNPATPQ